MACGAIGSSLVRSKTFRRWKDEKKREDDDVKLKLEKKSRFNGTT